MSDVTSSAGSTVDTTTSSMLTSFTIESIDISKVYVRNTGQNPLTSLSVYVNDEIADFNMTPSSIASGAVGTVTIYDFIDEGDTIKITSPSGFAASKSAPDQCTKAVACWKFDEGTGTVAYDSSGNGKSGTIYGASWTTGKYESALYFPGTISNSRVSLTTFLSTPSSLTASAWIKVDSDATSYPFIVGKAWINSWGLAIDGSSRRIRFEYYNSTGSENGAVSTDAITYGVWQHVAVTYSGGVVTFYLNGKKSGSTVIGSLWSENVPMTIGHLADGYDTWKMKGSIDEIRLYDRVIY
jgi:hypothetical protein